MSVPRFKPWRHEGPDKGAQLIALPTPPDVPALADEGDGGPTGGQDGDSARLRLADLAWLRTKVTAGAAPRVAWLVARRAPVWAWYLFRDLLIGGVRLAAVGYAWLHLSEERQAARKMESRDAKAKALRDINKDARFRIIASAIVGALVLAAHLVVLYGWQGRYAGWVAVEALALVGFLEWLGHQPRPEKDAPVLRRGPLTHGTSTRSLRRDLEEGFAAKKIPDVGVVAMTVNKYGWQGIFETEEKITDELIAHLERWIHAPTGSLMIAQDPRNAAAHPFKLLIDDPLAEPTVPEEAPRPRDIRKLAKVGRHLFGAPLLVNLRTHVGLIGRTRSGKSSGLWVLIDWITSCFNARVYGIDLSNGPALPTWRRCIHRRAHDPSGAAAILDELIAESIARNAELTRRAEDDSADADAELDENHDPTSAAPAIYLVIDEFHILADDKELLEKVKLLIRIGGKACVYLVLATPKASKEDLGSAVIRAMIGLKILFSCEAGDITLFLGGGMIDMGWHPHRLKPAAGGAPNDAGKAFILDGDHQTPELVRVSRLSANECRDRARRRSGVDLAKPSTPSTPPPLPESLALVTSAFAEFDRPAVPTAWVLRHAAETHERWSTDWAKVGPTGLAMALRSHGVTTGRTLPRDRAWKGAPKGYFRDDVERAAEALRTHQQ